MSDLIAVGALFQEWVDNVPERFFEIYNAMRNRGISHETADQAAREQFAWESAQEDSGLEDSGDEQDA